MAEEVRKRKRKEAQLRRFRGTDVPPLHNKKVWQPKFSLPKLETYRGAFPDEYWSLWPVVTWDQVLPPVSWVDGAALLRMARKARYGDEERLQRVVKRLEAGADIGCRGRGRLSTEKPNAESAYLHGDKVADAVRSWVEDQLVLGPMRKEDVPEGSTISPILVSIKDNGSARIILNFSSPHDKVNVPDGFYKETDPGSINSGINAKDFPAKMSSVRKFVRSLLMVGHGAYIIKLDMHQAYKHNKVRAEDIPLQFIEFGGRFFAELALVFGTGSSAGIFDDLAKVFGWLALFLVQYPPRLRNQHLDDTIIVGISKTRLLEVYNSYNKVAKRLGIRMASEEDPAKMLKPSLEATVLGVRFETDTLRWYMPENKMAVLLTSLKRMSEEEEVSNGLLLSTVGKIVNIACLIPRGKFNVGFIVKEGDTKQEKDVMMSISAEARRQARWWIEHVQWACWRATVVDPDRGVSPIRKEAFTDAAGGSFHSLGNGVGGVVFPSTWFYYNWPRNIQRNWQNSLGVGFKAKLTCLEGVGVLLAVCAAYQEIRGGALEVFCDNQGTVDISKKGYSTACPYSYTIVKAAFDVAYALNCQLVVTKIRRCTGKGAILADKLSKADFSTLTEEMPGMKEDPGFLPRTILKWLHDPFPDMDLGKAIVREMSSYVDVIIPE